MKLVIKLMEWAKELEYPKMVLEIGESRKESCLMYNKIGFRIIPNYGSYKNIPKSLCIEKNIERTNSSKQRECFLAGKANGGEARYHGAGESRKSNAY